MVKNALSYYNCIVQPGYLVFSHEPAFLCSVCGNGVVVIIWDKVRRIGGMTHCIFPKRRMRDKPSNYYADVAVTQLVAALTGKQCLAQNLEVQLFGGGSMRGWSAGRARAVVEMIRKILKKHRIDIVSEDIGGSVGRKVVFDTRSGDVVVIKTRRVRKSDWAPEYIVNNHGDKTADARENQGSDR